MAANILMISDGFAVNANSPMRKPGHKDLADLWDVWSCLEAATARNACAHVTKASLKQLRQLCSQRERAAQRHDNRAVDLGSIAFHQHIIEMSDNRLIKRIFHRRKLLERIFNVDYAVESFWLEFEATELGHRQIAEVLALRDPQVLESVIARHILTEKERRLAAFDIEPAQTTNSETRRNHKYSRPIKISSSQELRE